MDSIDVHALRITNPYIEGLLTILLVALLGNTLLARKQRHLPPGPRPLPLIGNLLDLPDSEEWVTWSSYVKRYGSLVYLTALGRNYLLLGSHEVIVDLLEKRPHFNDRFQNTMMNKIMGYSCFLPLTPYGSVWRKHRKIMYSQTQLGSAAAYMHIQFHGARRFVGDLLAAESGRPQDKLSAAANAILPRMICTHYGLTAIHMVYGIDIRSAELKARYVDVPDTVNQATSEASIPGRFLVDFVPILQYIPAWFPGAGFKRFGLKAAAVGRQARDDPLAAVKAQMAAGAAPTSMAARMLSSSPDDEEIIKDAAATIYLAGFDTTVASLTSYFLAMVKFPEVQRRVQEELDRVVGRARFPDWSDKDNLPYLEGVIRECLRWLPALPSGFPHMTTQDDEYRGHFIPKGTIVLPLQWEILHDAEKYPDPSAFSPERYLTRQSDGSWQLRDDVVDPRKYAFGFGRRVCPGKSVAEQGLFASLTTVIHTLNIIRAKDSNGREVNPDARMSSGALCHPLPFSYQLCQRDHSEKLVEICVAAAKGEGTPELDPLA